MIKVIIVDDEEWIRIGFKEQLDWNSLGIDIVADAPNGLVAKDLIDRCQPDIVVTDIRMPIMDGIKLMEYIHEVYPSIIIIVISSYSEFEYAKKAITCNAFGYILKPIEETELRNVMEGAIKKIEANKNEDKRYLSLEADIKDFHLNVMRDQLVNYLLGFNSHDEKMEEGIKGIVKDFKASKFLVIVLRIINQKMDFNNKFNGKNEAAILAAYNTANELLSSSEDKLVLTNYTRPDELIIIMGVEILMVGSYNSRYPFIDQIEKIIKNEYGFNLLGGISEAVTDFYDINKCYRQAVEAVQTAGMLGDRGVLHINNISERMGYFIYPKDKEKALLYCIEKGNKKQVLILIDLLFSEASKNSKFKTESIKNVIVDLIIKIERILNELNYSVKELMKLPSQPTKIIDEICTIDELKQWFSETVCEVMEYILCKKNTKNTFSEVINYIHNNYNEDINLNLLAERFYLNPTYLSRLFKNETGVNFIDYLTKIRMSNAAELLKDKGLKLSDIAYLVGYENANYFLKKFKDFYGCTPSEYKNKVGKKIVVQ